LEAGDRTPQLVILGASAGGIDALSSIVETIPASFDAPILIAQHLDPRRPSHLAEILGRRAAISVHGVEAATDLEAGHAYVLPAVGDMEVAIGSLKPIDGDAGRPSPSIDRILASAALAYGEGLTAVILTGSGSDGAAGARQVKAAGGTVIIQNPDTAAYPSMPMAISPSIVDIVADAQAIGPLLQELVSSPRPVKRGDDDRALRSFLAFVRERGGIDFGTYKRGTIQRRLQRRMIASGTGDLADYRRHLEEHPEEFARLTSSFLIKVTEFFRDPELFDHLRETIVPEIVDGARQAKRELRIWSAGCATGEEAYSLAMLVAEALGDDVGRLGVRIFATDLDLDAIAFARRGTYAASVVSDVPEELLSRWFTKTGDRYEVSKQLRGMTVFGQHDLGQRAPFPRVDLALCRNVLIYFTPELQRRALQLFAFSLREGGYLVLGKSESTTPLSDHFVLSDSRQKVFRRQGARVLIPPARTFAGLGAPALQLPVARRPGWVEPAARDVDKPVSMADRAEQLFLRLPVGIVVVNQSYDVQLINLAARELLGIAGQAVAEDLVHQLESGLADPVRKLIDAVRRGTTPDPVVIERPSLTAEQQQVRYVEIKVEPYTSGGTKRRGAAQEDSWILITATDVTGSIGAARNLVDSATRESGRRERAIEQAQALSDANEELRTANRDLTTANAELRTANEELLLASEEVQAATEEVETLNEELQATNEELETLNEELQATVEELNTTNDDLEARSVELQETALTVETQRAASEADRLRLLSILDLIEVPVLMVDAAGEIQTANRAFRTSIGDPASVNLQFERDGSPGEGRDPLERASLEAFTAAVRVAKRRYTAESHPIESDGGRAGVLLFTPH
jgi:two-component system, chemotaxis family, CheB/CheR fusion protein